MTDFNLSERKTGLDVATELRRQAPGLAIVFVTGRPDLLGHHAMDGRQRLLRKPFPVAELVQAQLEGRAPKFAD